MPGFRLGGKIVDLVGDRGGTLIRLDNDPKDGPKDNVWKLELGHDNYNALYSLALAAAINRWPVGIRIAGDEEINQQREAGIKSLGVTWSGND